jgi:predicted HTH domain antitoxin
VNAFFEFYYRPPGRTDHILDKQPEGGYIEAMIAHQITIDLPQEIIGLPSSAGVEQEVKRYLAVKYYREEALTIGKAAELAGMGRMEFEIFLAHNQIPISLLDYDDIQSDLAKMKNIRAAS